MQNPSTKYGKRWRGGMPNHSSTPYLSVLYTVPINVIKWHDSALRELKAASFCHNNFNRYVYDGLEHEQLDDIHSILRRGRDRDSRRWN